MRLLLTITQKVNKMLELFEIRNDIVSLKGSIKELGDSL